METLGWLLIPQVSPTRDEVFRRAVQIMGWSAITWMNNCVRALDNHVPIIVWDDREWRERIMDVLTQLEHGVL
jgi:uncharacterized protein (DUF2384 family)